MAISEKLKDDLRHMQSHPTTGTAHNEQLISTQVETIFAVDKLGDEVNKLSSTIISLDKQNQSLEQTNIRLQWVMVALTIATVLLTVLTLFK